MLNLHASYILKYFCFFVPVVLFILFVGMFNCPKACVENVLMIDLKSYSALERKFTTVLQEKCTFVLILGCIECTFHTI